MSGYIQSNQCVLLPDQAAFNILAADSGKILLLPQQNQPTTVTLPPLQAGLCYKVILVGLNGGAGAGDITTFGPNTAANIFYGTLINKTAATAVAYVSKSGAAGAQILVAAVQGDSMTLNCDGTSWYVSGLSSAVGFA